MLVRSVFLFACAVTACDLAAGDPLLTKAQIVKAARDIEACLEKDSGNGSACVGLVQGPCDDAISAGGEAAHATCADNETAAWDVLLNEAWRDLPTKLGPAHFAALKDVQKRWVGYRDVKCGFLKRAEGGWGLMLASHCRLDETARRVRELRDILGDPNFAAE